MNIERRSSIREPFDRILGGRISLFIESEQHPILQVNDISPFGLGVVVAHAPALSSQIRLQYQTDDQTIVVDGEVAWVSAAPAVTSEGRSGFRAGIYLNPENAVDNVALFNELSGND